MMDAIALREKLTPAEIAAVDEFVAEFEKLPRESQDRVLAAMEAEYAATRERARTTQS